MGSTSSYQAAPPAEIIQETSETIQETNETIQETSDTTQLSMTPDEALAKIQPFLSFSISDPTNCRLVHSFRQHYGEYMEARYLPWNPLGHLYEQLMFSRGGDIIPPTPERICQPLYFRPNVNLSSAGAEQSGKIQIHVFTTSDSEKVHLNEISSMIIESSTWSYSLDESISSYSLDEFSLGAEYFVKTLFRCNLVSLRKFKLSGFRMTPWLWDFLSQLDLDCVHYTPRYVGGNLYFRYGLQKPERFHMNLRESFDLSSFPILPRLLKEISLHISNPLHNESHVNLECCNSLEKM